jgi:AcrR family transcriptional regulator
MHKIQRAGERISFAFSGISPEFFGHRLIPMLWFSRAPREEIRRQPPLFKRSKLTAGIRQSSKTARKPRADAARNRERVLEAAKAVFSAGGPDASLEAVARTAGVGIGTLYRHFPTREALFEAVYRREVQHLADLAESLKDKTEPVDALRQWMRSNVKFVATKKGMSEALALAAYKNSELFSYSLESLTHAVGSLLDRAVAAGKIRDDIGPEDLLRALVGMCYTHNQPGWQKSVLRLIDVFIDGLRVQVDARTLRAKTKRSSS